MRCGRIVALSITLTILFTALSPAQQNIPPEWGEAFDYKPGENVRVEKDIVYARYGDRELKLDLYLPKQSSKAVPVIIVIRGGGWIAGDKEGFGRFAAYMAERGLAAACIEYRTSNEAAFPAAVHDIKAAVRWARAHASEYGIDGAAIGAFGGSAGAHLAMMLAASHKAKDLEGDGGNPGVSSRIQACVAMATPTDFTSLHQTYRQQPGELPKNLLKIEEKFLGAALSENPEVFKKASPVTYVDKDSPPALLMNSVADPVVPFAQSIQLLEKYNECGAYAECRLITGAPHAFWNFTAWAYDEMDRTVAFFKKHMMGQ